MLTIILGERRRFDSAAAHIVSWRVARAAMQDWRASGDPLMPFDPRDGSPPRRHAPFSGRIGLALGGGSIANQPWVRSTRHGAHVRAAARSAAMSDRQRPQIIDPLSAIGSGEAGPYPFDLYERQCIAQGDSWFSIGALPPTKTTRVLSELALLKSTVIVNCAYPGAKLRRMVDSLQSPYFCRFMAGKLAMKWHAILFSGGGNDLIEAVGALPSAPPEQRLLRTAAERGAGPLTPADYLSAPGWATFVDHIGAVFNRLIDLRDSGVNRSTPFVWHNYARVMPRPAPAGLGFGPWLLPALILYAVPPADQLGVADELLARLRVLIDELAAARQAKDAQCAVHVADSMSADIALAEADTTGVSGDWVNEIHLTRGGYQKCAGVWQQVLDPLLA
jgi:hypothetical protein